jgi:hypothetical protein
MTAREIVVAWLRGKRTTSSWPPIRHEAPPPAITLVSETCAGGWDCGPQP